MHSIVYAPWDHIPKFLRQSEVREPLLLVKYFFDANDIEGHLETLKTWRHYVVNEGFYNDILFGPGTLIYDHELNVRLLEGLYLLMMDHEENLYSKNKIEKEQLNQEKVEWQWFPLALTEKELSDPYIIIKAAFDDLRLQEFRDHLSEWLSAALCVEAIDESITPGEIITVYEHLKKLYSAAWLIYQRDTDRTRFKNKHKDENKSVMIGLHTDKTPDEEVVDGRVEEKIINYPDTAPAPGLKELTGHILKANSAVKLVIHIDTVQNPLIHYLLVIVDYGGILTKDELAVRLEQDCACLAIVIVLVQKVKWLYKAAKKNSVFFQHVFRKDKIVYRSPAIELPKLQENTHIPPDWELIEIWQKWLIAGKDSCNTAWEDYLEKNYSSCLFMVRCAVDELLKALIGMYMGYLPQTRNLERLLKMSLLFTERVWNLFHTDADLSKRAWTLLIAVPAQDPQPETGPIDEDSLHLLVLNVKLLTMLAEDEYNRLIRQHSEQKESRNST